MSRTPVTRLDLYDHLTSEEALFRAWRDGGVHPAWHARMQREVREAMPLLARALDRMTAPAVPR